MSLSLLKSSFAFLALLSLAGAIAHADDKGLAGEVSVTFKGADFEENEARVSDHGGAIDGKVSYKGVRDDIGGYELIGEGGWGAFGKENAKTGFMRVGAKLLRGPGKVYMLNMDENGQYEIGGEIFNEIGLLTNRAGLRLNAARLSPKGNLQLSVTPVGRDFDKNTGTKGVYSGLSAGVSKSILGLFDVKGLLDAGMVFTGGRDLVIETEYVSETERIQRITQTALSQKGPATTFKARLGIARKLGSNAEAEIYVEADRRDADYVETGFDGMVLNNISTGSTSLETGAKLQARFQ